MTPDQKIRNVEAQVRAVRRGATNTVRCPYCLESTQVNGALCCDTFRKALAAVVMKFKAEHETETFHRIQEGMAKQQHQSKHARN